MSKSIEPSPSPAPASSESTAAGVSHSVLRLPLSVLQGHVDPLVERLRALGAALPEGETDLAGASGTMQPAEAAACEAVLAVAKQRPELFTTCEGDGVRVPFDDEGLAVRLGRFHLLASLVALEPILLRAKLAMKEIGSEVRARVEAPRAIAQAVAAVDKEVAHTLEPATKYWNRGAIARKRHEVKAKRNGRKAGGAPATETSAVTAAPAIEVQEAAAPASASA